MKEVITASVTPEFSRPIPVDGLKDCPKVFEIEADPEERLALAKRFSLVSLFSLSARISLTHGDGALVSLEGELCAEVTQTCVITLESVDNLIETSFKSLYRAGASAGHDEGRNKEISVLQDEDALLEPIVDGIIDIGEAAAEQLALELDPFPRKPGSALEDFSSDSEVSGGAAPPSGPFSKLAKLINNSEE